MKVKANNNTGTFSEEALAIINDIKQDIEMYKHELEDYYNGNDSVLDSETRVYVETELIPKLELDLEYYENYYLYN